MKTATSRLFVVLLLVILQFSFPNKTYAVDSNGYDQIVAQLRVDLPQVSGSMDYRTWIVSNGNIPINDPTTTFTAAWLAVEDPVFFQVGIMVDRDGYRWFAMSNNGYIHCNEGRLH